MTGENDLSSKRTANGLSRCPQNCPTALHELLAVDSEQRAQRRFRISNPRPTGQPFAPSREVVEQMMERDDGWGWFANAPEGL